MKIGIRVLAIIAILSLCFTFNNRFLLNYYNNSALYGSFLQKRERAEKIDVEKIIVVGGSASNLGFDSKYFEQLSGKPAVNLAVSAGIPLKVYMRAAELCAKNGDVLIMPLEYDYYNSDIDEICESYVDMVGVDPDLKCDENLWNSIEYYSIMFLRSFTRMNDCIVFALKNLMGSENTIYIADSVDEYGDFCVHKDRIPTYVSTANVIQFKHNSETLHRIYDFIKQMEQKGVTVYLTYPCVDRNQFMDCEQYFAEVQQIVEDYIPTKNIIGTPSAFGYDPEFFFDTAYHIRYENREIYTEKLFTLYNQIIQ